MAWREWVQDFEIEPSIYAANFAALGVDLERALDAGARILHFDVGDGHFVEPITIGPIVLESIAPLVHARGAVLDCHLMVDNPEHHFAQIAKAGGDSVTFHHEVVADVAATAAKAREVGLGVGLAFNPESEVADVAARVEDLDLVLCMSIHPGYSGQAFMPRPSIGSGSFGRRWRAMSTFRSTVASRWTTFGQRAKLAPSSWSPGARSSTARIRARPTVAWSTQLRDRPSPSARSPRGKPCFPREPPSYDPTWRNLPVPPHPVPPHPLHTLTAQRPACERPAREGARARRAGSRHDPAESNGRGRRSARGPGGR